MPASLSKNRSIQKLGVAGLVLLVVALGITVFALGQSAAKGSACSALYFIDITLPTRARWTMCWEERANEGIVLYDITYTPPGQPARLVLAQANLAQLHVPYDDNGARLHDLSDFGLGGTHLANLSADECRGGALLASNGKNVLCRQVSERGYAYKYYGSQMQGYLLTLFSVSQVGAYNYIVQWNFYDNGDIEPVIGATGRLQFYTDAAGSSHGWPLDAGNTHYGLAHAHNYYWRLDFDLISAEDDLVEELAFDFSADRSQVSGTRLPLTTETARQVDPAHFRAWRVLDKMVANDDGHPISYQLEPDARQLFRGPDFEPFTQDELYVTRYNPCEKWVSHNPTLGGCADNVTGFVNGENIDGADVVLWYGHTFHHLPRDEDEPNMHSHWSSFVISPRDWTATNPLAGVTPIPPTVTPPPNSALVKLASFQARWQNDSVAVEWATLTEINTAAFNLLRSTGGLTWTQVITAASQHPCQTFSSTTPTLYNFVDTAVVSPTVVSYRLEFDGAACGAQTTLSTQQARAWPNGHVDLFLPVIVK